MHYKNKRGNRMPKAPSVKGSPSKTRPGDLDYTTKKGDRDFHQRHHDIRRSRDPFKVALHLHHMSK